MLGGTNYCYQTFAIKLLSRSWEKSETLSYETCFPGTSGR